MSKYVSKENLNNIVQEMGKKIPSILNLTNEELQEIINAFEPEFGPEDEDKADRSLSNLTNEGKDRFLGDDNFTIIYPNNGTAANPANVAVSSRYVESNPFHGYIVDCVAEVYCNNQWGNPMYTYVGTGGYGAAANQLNDDTIVLQTGAALIVDSTAMGSPFGHSGSTITSPLPCRIKVWKIGKVANS